MRAVRSLKLFNKNYFKKQLIENIIKKYFFIFNIITLKYLKKPKTLI